MPWPISCPYIVWHCRPSHREESLVKPIYMQIICSPIRSHQSRGNGYGTPCSIWLPLTLTVLFKNLLNRNESMGYATLKYEQTEAIINILSGNDVFTFIVTLIVQHVYSRALHKATMTYQPQAHSICTSPVYRFHQTFLSIRRAAMAD